ncbi:MAG: hypothetical protein Q9178_003666 [Gyalolechia marmorata]
MPKSKDRTLNPAAAQLKADKARALKKGKAAITAQRTARLAQRNPLRLERQIADLKAAGGNEGGGGGLGKGEKRQLEELERQLGLVRRAREKVGGDARGGGESGRGGGGGGGWERGRGGRGGGGVLGKRNRDVSGGQEGNDNDSDGTSTDESVRRIPMPRDTPPPLPSFHHRASRIRGGGMHYTPNNSGRGNANMEPINESRSRIPHHHHALPPKPDAGVIPAAAPPKTTYEAKPIVRDLRKEAVKAFMPAVVARKVQAVRGVGGRLLEEEEVERLEREGYMRGGLGGKGSVVVAPEVGEGVGDDDDEEKRRLEEEEERFRREVGMKEEQEEERVGRGVRMEEVRDEDL